MQFKLQKQELIWPKDGSEKWLKLVTENNSIKEMSAVCD